MGYGCWFFSFPSEGIAGSITPKKRPEWLMITRMWHATTKHGDNVLQWLLGQRIFGRAGLPNPLELVYDSATRAARSICFVMATGCPMTSYRSSKLPGNNKLRLLQVVDRARSMACQVGFLLALTERWFGLSVSVYVRRCFFYGSASCLFRLLVAFHWKKQVKWNKQVYFTVGFSKAGDQIARGSESTSRGASAASRSFAT
jgi:hypothetical protein